MISIAEPGVEPGPSAKETDKLPLLHPARCSEYPLEWLNSPWNGRKGPLRIPKVRTKKESKNILGEVVILTVVSWCSYLHSDSLCLIT